MAGIVQGLALQLLKAQSPNLHMKRVLLRLACLALDMVSHSPQDAAPRIQYIIDAAVKNIKGRGEREEA
eukprot:4194034-Amphidinium_carterae.1